MFPLFSEWAFHSPAGRNLNAPRRGWGGWKGGSSFSLPSAIHFGVIWKMALMWNEYIRYAVGVGCVCLKFEIIGNYDIHRDCKNSLFFFRKSRLFLVCFCLNLVWFLVAFSLKKSPFRLLSASTLSNFFTWSAFFSKHKKIGAKLSN